VTRISSLSNGSTLAMRVLTAGFKKLRLMWDFTVSGEILRVGATRLWEKPENGSPATSKAYRAS